MDKDPDARLVAACRQGNRKAFEALLMRYERPVYNIAMRMLGHAEDARDVTQTTFLKVYERLDQFDGQHRFFSWIYRIAINEAINLLNGRKREAPLDGLEPEDDRSPVAEYGSAQRCARVQRAVMQLSTDARAVITLRYFADCSYRDMAEVLGVPEKTVKSRLFSARQLLRDQLARDELEAD